MNRVGEYPLAVPRALAGAKLIVPAPLVSGVDSATRERSRRAPGVQGSPFTVSRTAIYSSACTSVMAH